MTIRAKRLEVLLSGKQANKKNIAALEFFDFFKKNRKKKTPVQGIFLQFVSVIRLKKIAFQNQDSQNFL
jgi:hypothetical protein